jgi:hypothetical protein
MGLKVTTGCRRTSAVGERPVSGSAKSILNGEFGALAARLLRNGGATQPKRHGRGIFAGRLSGENE